MQSMSSGNRISMAV